MNKAQSVSELCEQLAPSSMNEFSSLAAIGTGIATATAIGGAEILHARHLRKMYGISDLVKAHKTHAKNIWKDKSLSAKERFYRINAHEGRSIDTVAKHLMRHQNMEKGKAYRMAVRAHRGSASGWKKFAQHSM